MKLLFRLGVLSQAYLAVSFAAGSIIYGDDWRLAVEATCAAGFGWLWLRELRL